MLQPRLAQQTIEDGVITGAHWAVSDRLGTVAQMVDEHAVIVEHREYDPHGVIEAVYDHQGALAGTEPLFTVVAHAGAFYDDWTGNYQMRQRWYDPQARRFLSEDPIQDGANWYAFAGNDPINFRDPSGLSQAGNPLEGLSGGFGTGNVAPKTTSALANVTQSLFRPITNGLSHRQVNAIRRWLERFAGRTCGCDRRRAWLNAVHLDCRTVWLRVPYPRWAV